MQILSWKGGQRRDLRMKMNNLFFEDIFNIIWDVHFLWKYYTLLIGIFTNFFHVFFPSILSNNLTLPAQI